MPVSAVELTKSNSITNSDIVKAKRTLLPDLISILLETPEALGISPNDVKDAVIGDDFSISQLSGSILSEVKDILYWPIISNNQIIALITLIKYNGELSASIGKDFSEELTNMIYENEGNLALFSNEQNIYCVNNESEVSEVFIASDLDATTFSTTILSEITYDSTCNNNNVISYDNILTSTENIADYLISNETRATSSYLYLTDYPIVYQGSLPICWAATVAAMVIYEVSSINNLTATQVCNAINHSYTGGSNADIINALNHYLPSIYVPTEYSRAMTKSEIQVIINNNDPACMLSQDINSTSRHATSLCGYRISGSSFQIRLMDSAYECFKFSTYSSTNGFRFAFGNTQYEWDSTIRLMYNV